MIAAKVANALRARLAARALEIIVAVDGGDDATPRGARRGRGPGARAPARRQDPRAGRRGPRPRAARSIAFSDANALWEPDALRELVKPFADPQVGYACGQVDVHQRRRHQPGRPVLALRDVAARAGVGARLGHRRQRRDLRGAPRGLHRGRPDHGPRPQLPVPMVKRGWRAVYVPAARATREDGPAHRGRVGAQAADDVPRVADRRQGRARRPARVLAAVRADDRLATGCCATARRSCTC